MMQVNLILADKQFHKLVLVLLFVSQSCIAQHQEKNTVEILFDIRFTDYFNRDTVDFFINDVMMLNDRVLESDKSDGLTDIHIQIILENGKYYAVLSPDRKEPISIQPTNVKAVVNINGNQQTFTLNKEKGIYVEFSKGRDGKVFLTQSESRPIYD